MITRNALEVTVSNLGKVAEPGISQIKRWNSLDQQTFDAPRLNVFKNQLTRIGDNRKDGLLH